MNESSTDAEQTFKEIIFEINATDVGKNYTVYFELKDANNEP